jgi:hypothetical protein
VCLMGGLYPAAEILGPISITRGSRLRWSIAVVGIYVSDRCAVKFVNVLCKNGTFYSGFIEHKNDWGLEVFIFNTACFCDEVLGSIL